MGIDDSWVDGDRAYTITTQTSSLDTTYENLAPITISAVNQDDDSAQLAVSSMDGRSSHGGATVSFVRVENNRYLHFDTGPPCRYLHFDTGPIDTCIDTCTSNLPPASRSNPVGVNIHGLAPEGPH